MLQTTKKVNIFCILIHRIHFLMTNRITFEAGTQWVAEKSAQCLVALYVCITV